MVRYTLQDGDGDLDDDDVDELFSECDADGSGYISVSELRVALERRHGGGPRQYREARRSVELLQETRRAARDR